MTGPADAKKLIINVFDIVSLSGRFPVRRDEEQGGWRPNLMSSRAHHLISLPLVACDSSA